MVAAVRPRLENHRPEKMAPSFNLLPRLARVMGSVLPQLGRQHFSSIHYFNCPILNGLFPSSQLFSGMGPETCPVESGHTRPIDPVRSGNYTAYFPVTYSA